MIEPYDLRTPNVEERPPGVHTSAFFIGGYDDGDLLYIDTERDGATVRCSRDTGAEEAAWTSFAAMLVAEVERLADSSTLQ